MRQAIPRTRKLLAATAVATALIVGALTGCTAPPAEEADGPDDVLTLRYGIGGNFGLYWQIFAGEHAGIFAEHGLDVETVVPRGGSATDLLALLLSNEIDISDSLPDPVLAAAASGGPELAVLNFNGPIVYSVVARSGIESYDDLAAIDKKIQVGVSSPTAAIAGLARQVLSEEGIEPDRYDFVALGGTNARLAAVVNNSVDITFLTQPADFQADAMGLKVLSVTPDVAPWYGVVDVVKKADLTGETCEKFSRFYAALADIGTYLRDPANKDDVIEALVDEAENSQSDAELSYDMYLDLDAMPGINDPTESLEKTKDMLDDLGTPSPDDATSLVSTDCMS